MARPSGEAFTQSILEQGYELVEHGIDRDDIEAVADAYATFAVNLPDPKPETFNALMPCADPKRLDELDYAADTQSDWHKYRTNHPQLHKPGGYTNRTLQVEILRAFGRDEMPTGEPFPDEDPKQFYHYHPNALQRMREMHERYGWGAIPSEVENLHARFSAVYDQMRRVTRGVLTLLDETHPELLNEYAADLDDPEGDIGPMRFLFYDLTDAPAGSTMAERHVDKGRATFQIAENFKGLRVLNPLTREMSLVDREPEYAAFFPSWAWSTEEHFPDSDLKGTPHDVIKINELNPGRTEIEKLCGRWSLILFLNSEVAGDKTATHV